MTEHFCSFLYARVFYATLISCICLQLINNTNPQCSAGEPLEESTYSDPAEARPNIVLIYADDVDCETVFGSFPVQDSNSVQFPNLRRLAKSGTRFSNFHVTTPVCGPSRACLYSGQYAHRNRCRVNDSNSIRSLGFTGGFHTFDPENELSFWMKEAGYRTAHVGKYLHEGFKPDYEAGIKWKDIVPPGWDFFEVSLGSRYFDYPSYSKTKDMILGRTPGYRTDNEVDRAIGIVEAHLAANDSNKPLFLSWSPISAHIPGDRSEMRAERHREKFIDSFPSELTERLKDPVRNQIDEMKNLAMPDQRKINLRIAAWQNRMSAMLALDENIGRLLDEFESRGILKNTIFIFTSDHGFRYFQHRHFGKRLPYDRITRVPFIVSGPGIPKDFDCNALLANIDIAPTLVDIASRSVPKTCDGISFARLLKDPNLETGREAILIENWGEVVTQRSFVPATYCSMRSRDTVYTAWATGGLEYFNLKTDPSQRNNLYPDLDASTRNKLVDQMKRLRTSNDPPTLSKVILKRKQLCGTIKPVEISGYAESSSGLDSVGLEIQCEDSNQYWDGNRWTNERVSIPAGLDQEHGTVSRWTCKLDSRKFAMNGTNDLSERNVTLNVLALDMNQQKAELKDAAKFRLAFIDPETTIADISGNDQLTIHGTASDLKKIAKVSVAIRQTRTGMFWNGSQWQKELHQFDSELAEKSSAFEIPRYRWNFETGLKLKSDRITVIARAYGPNGLFDHSPAIKTVLIR